MALFHSEHQVEVTIGRYIRPEVERSLRDQLRQPLMDALHQLVDNARQASANRPQTKRMPMCQLQSESAQLLDNLAAEVSRLESQLFVSWQDQRKSTALKKRERPDGPHEWNCFESFYTFVCDQDRGEKLSTLSTTLRWSLIGNPVASMWSLYREPRGCNCSPQRGIEVDGRTELELQGLAYLMNLATGYALSHRINSSYGEVYFGILFADAAPRVFSLLDTGLDDWIG